MTWTDVVERWLAAGAQYREQMEQALAGLPCAYCGDSAQTLDHVVPRAAGGPDDGTNLVPVCRSCNGSKSARSLEEWARVIRTDLARTDKRRRQLAGVERLLDTHPMRPHVLPDPAADAELDAALARVPAWNR